MNANPNSLTVPDQRGRLNPVAMILTVFGILFAIFLVSLIVVAIIFPALQNSREAAK